MIKRTKMNTTGLCHTCYFIRLREKNLKQEANVLLQLAVQERDEALIEMGYKKK